VFDFNQIPLGPFDTRLWWLLIAIAVALVFPFLPRSLDGFVDFMNQYGPMILLGLILLSIFIPGFSPFSFILALIRPILSLFGLPTLF